MQYTQDMGDDLHEDSRSRAVGDDKVRKSLRTRPMIESSGEQYCRDDGSEQESWNYQKLLPD